jgi:hypothetical protein
MPKACLSGRACGSAVSLNCFDVVACRDWRNDQGITLRVDRFPFSNARSVKLRLVVLREL